MRVETRKQVKHFKIALFGFVYVIQSLSFKISVEGWFLCVKTLQPFYFIECFVVHFINAILSEGLATGRKNIGRSDTESCLTSSEIQVTFLKLLIAQFWCDYFSSSGSWESQKEVELI